MKKALSLILGAMMLTSVVTGCSGTAASSTASTAGSADVPNVIGDTSKEPVTISVLTTNGASLHYDWENMTWWNEVLKRANVKLEMEMLESSTYSDSVKPRLAAGQELPELVNVPGKDADMAYINAGLFTDLTDMVDKRAVYLKEQWAAHSDLEVSMRTPDGKIYYMPYVLTQESNMRCVMINTEWVEKVGMKVEDIKTIDDYTAFLRACKGVDMNGNGKDDEVPMFSRSGMIGLWGIHWGLDLADGGGYQLGDDGKVFCSYTDERYLDFLTWAHTMYEEGLLYNEFMTANYDVQQDLYSNRRAGSVMHFISNCTGYSQTFNPDWVFNQDACIMKPIVLTGPTGVTACYGRGSSGGTFGISSTCEKPETVFDFCDYLLSEEVGKLTWYGIEGSDYIVENGVEVFSQTYLDNKDNYLTNMGYNASHLPSYQYDYSTKQCDEVRQAAKDLTPYIINPSIGFSYKTDEQNETISTYAADLSTYFSENMIAFITGTRSLSEWDAYVKTAKDMGVDEMVAMHQMTFDRMA